MIAETERRDQVRDHVLRKAEADPRIVAAAVVGSLALGDGDRWSDLDLSFGVSEGTGTEEVVADWTRELADELGTVPLIDVRRGELVYRVFLLPDWLQLDLSFTPRRTLQTSPAFRPLFGEHEQDLAPAPEPRELLGFAVLFARHAFVTIERGLWWQAEFCVGQVLELALTLACLRRELPYAYGKGYDRLPAEVLRAAEEALVRSLDPDELRRSLRAAVTLLLVETEDPDAQVERLRNQLREL